MNETTLTNPLFGNPKVAEAIAAGRKALEGPYPPRETQPVDEALGINYDGFERMVELNRRALELGRMSPKLNKEIGAGQRYFPFFPKVLRAYA